MGPLLLSSLTWGLSALVRGVARTWRVRREGATILEDALREGPVILTFLHEDMVPMVVLHRHVRIAGMASPSRDGEILAGVIARFGFRVIRGSSSRGGMRAARDTLRAMEEGWNPALAVDGPHGPRGVPHPGAATLAHLAHRPIVWASAVARPASRARSWDRTLLPWPFARVDIRYGRLEAPSRDSDIAGVTAALAEGLGDRRAR